LADQWWLTKIQEFMAIPAVFMIFANGCVMDIKFAKKLNAASKGYQFDTWQKTTN
jgi:hypothetical protein